jgi:superfamily II DNA or RNA helicase
VFLGIDPQEIGQIGASKRKGNGRLDVAMIQSLVRKGQVDDRVASYGQVVVDECHHLPAVSFERVLSEAKARYVVGLTATLQRRDGHHPITEMQLGAVRFAIGPRSRDAARPFAQRLYVRDTGFRVVGENGGRTIQRLYAALAADEKRNALILDDVIRSLEEGRSPILLTERRDHLEFLANRLESFTRHLVVLRGGMSEKERREAKEHLAAIPDSEERLVLATGRYVGEGFDDARLDTLFLALPLSWRGTLIQYTGRLHRPHPGKKEVRVFDYVDRDVPMLLRMFERRLRGYRAMGYTKGEAQPGTTGDELVIEYDEEVPRAFEAADEFS